ERTRRDQPAAVARLRDDAVLCQKPGGGRLGCGHLTAPLSRGVVLGRPGFGVCDEPEAALLLGVVRLPKSLGPAAPSDDIAFIFADANACPRAAGSCAREMVACAADASGTSQNLSAQSPLSQC